MKKNNKVKSTIFTVIGLLVLAAGLLSLMLFDAAGMTAPYLCIGLGCGLFGHGIGELATLRSEKKYPEAARRREIEENDERNIAVRDRSQAKAYRIMMPVFGALLLAFALMNVDLRCTLLLAAAYLYVCGCKVFYSVKYGKEM